jgi:coenzyme F420-0:L-glutamate ligase/coenzyme F420-1:gamma-L-glutamate ligase
VQPLSIIPIGGIPEVTPGAELAELIADAAAGQQTPLQDGDCVVVTQKVVSKAEGRLSTPTTATRAGGSWNPSRCASCAAAAI